ncbi:hypothetical protein Dimus_036545 [Dionaea muscipula]
MSSIRLDEFNQARKVEIVAVLVVEMVTALVVLVVEMVTTLVVLGVETVTLLYMDWSTPTSTSVGEYWRSEVLRRFCFASLLHGS